MKTRPVPSGTGVRSAGRSVREFPGLQTFGSKGYPVAEDCAIAPPSSQGSESACRAELLRGRPRWYVIQAKPREDARALENLKRQGFSCYCPTLSVEKCRQGRRIQVEEPLFPGYLFIQLEEVGQNWSPIRSTRGVLQLVRFNEHPVSVPDQIIERIRNRLTEERPSVPYLQPGERVRITEGPFAHLDAIFLANDGSKRVLLLMNILHGEQKLSFPVESVRKARGGRLSPR